MNTPDWRRWDDCGVVRRFCAEAFPGSAGSAACSGEIVYNGAVSPSRTGLMSITGVPSIASILNLDELTSLYAKDLGAVKTYRIGPVGGTGREYSRESSLSARVHFERGTPIHAAMSAPKCSVRPESHRALQPTPDRFPAWLLVPPPRVASEHRIAQLRGNVHSRLERSHRLVKPFLYRI